MTTAPGTAIEDENRPRWGNLTAGTLVFTADCFDLVSMTYLLPFVIVAFHISLGVASLLLLATTSSRWIGGLLFGSVATRFGRKPTIILGVAIVGCLTILSGMAPTFLALLGLRFLFGFGVGGLYGTAGTLVRESAGNRGGAFSGIMILGWMAGGALSPLYIAWLLPIFGWRGTFVAEGMILLLLPYLIFGVRESEVWIASRAAIAKGAEYTKGAFTSPIGVSGRRGFWHLFSPAFLGTTIMLVILEMGNNFTQSAGSLLPTYLKGEHFALGSIALIGSVASFAAMPGSLLGGYICDRLGRKRTFRLMFGIIWIPVGVTLFFPGMPLTLIAWGVYGVINGALGASLAVFETEQYPTDLRAPGYGFAHNLGTFGASLGVTLAAFLSNHFGLPPSLFVLTLFGVLLGYAAIAFARETAGKSLVTGEIVDPAMAKRAARSLAEDELARSAE